ncbi:hypothetical protein PM082_001375 [Marasmius tenuissimus]|nr:hypothetical protein PM082_001375 [Marasmius tenuissimus]
MSLLPRSTRLYRALSRQFTISTPYFNTSNEGTIAGTAPSYRCYVFLHSSIPPSAFPAKFMTPLQRELQLRVLQWGGFVNWAYYGPDSSGVDPTQGHGDATLTATAFTSFGERINVPELSRSTLDEVDGTLRRRVEQPSRKMSMDQIHLLVCTHMARDCRCGDLGGAYVRALRAEVEKRKKQDDQLYSRVKIGEVGHVGQHKFAPNMLVYPRGDWLGQLSIDNIPETLESIIRTSISTPSPSQIDFPKKNWRGRMALSKEEQLELYHST